MKIQIHGARTLKSFTAMINEGFKALSEVDDQFELVQIHGSPESLVEDKFILSQLNPQPKIFLLHRPDEILLDSELKYFFETHPLQKIVLLGDLILKDPFWNARREFIKVIPHPFLDLNLPVKSRDQFVIGSFTSWGEMRKLEHFFSLLDELKKTSVWDSLCPRIGGTIEGTILRTSHVDHQIEVSSDFFVPHFNIQLYHLGGKKRLGESSGSLHRGVGIPVIFEANGTERLEDLRVIKVIADNELSNIDFTKAALDIEDLILKNRVDEVLLHNLASAQRNSPTLFAQKVLDFYLK